MAYKAINVWDESRKRSAVGLGDDTDADALFSYMTPDFSSDSSFIAPVAPPANLDPIPANPQYASELASGNFLPGVTGPSSFLGLIDTLTGQPLAQASVPNPTSVTAAVNNPPSSIPSWVGYVAVGILVMVLFKAVAG